MSRTSLNSSSVACWDLVYTKFFRECKKCLWIFSTFLWRKNKGLYFPPHTHFLFHLNENKTKMHYSERLSECLDVNFHTLEILESSHMTNSNAPFEDTCVAILCLVKITLAKWKFYSDKFLLMSTFILGKTYSDILLYLSFI